MELPLQWDRHVVVAGTRHPCARKRRLTLADLAEESWVVPPPGAFIRGFLADIFRANGLPEPHIVVTAGAYMRMMLVANGRLLTMIPAMMLRLGARHLSIKKLPVALPTGHRPIAVVTVKNRALSPVAQLFIDHARSLAKSIAKD